MSRTCPYCSATVINPFRRFCPKCGRDIRAEDTPPRRSDDDYLNTSLMSSAMLDPHQASVLSTGVSTGTEQCNPTNTDYSSYDSSSCGSSSSGGGDSGGGGGGGGGGE